MKGELKAYLDELDIITILLSKHYSSTDLPHFKLNDGVQARPLLIENFEEFEDFRKYRCRTPEDLTLDKTYYVDLGIGFRTDLLIGSVMRTKKFDQLYYYGGNDLGPTYYFEETVFKVWAPTATKVVLHIYNKQGLLGEIHEMKRQDKGVWSTTKKGDCEGMFYTYNVCVNQIWREAVDPYVKAVSVNGQFGVVVDLTKTKVNIHSSQLPAFASPTDAIIYEAHIRDLTIHPESGIKNKGKYLGLTEEETKGPNGCKTGIDYLEELGITHLELLPINDYGGVDEAAKEEDAGYNWGYNPVHYNVPEGSYATDPFDPYVRIKEVKLMIEALHQKGIRVIVDVVYNHVYIREQSSFWKIVPGYYFRYNEFGLPSNGTGVGNDVASERQMVRKFIIDSVTFWAKEYNIDGFRFDLMGILDIETMNEVRRAAEEINPSILILGEGWNLNTPLPEKEKAMIANANKMPGVAHFNDRFRDAVKGSIFLLHDKGFASGDKTKCSKMKYLFAGSSLSFSGNDADEIIFTSPSQSVNYIECHDNHTLFDKLSVSNGDETLEVRMKRQRLAIAMLLFAQGIPFLHSGIEFYRTKYGEGNSFNLPDHINQLDWARKNMSEHDISYIRTLIQIRKAHPAFRLDTAAKLAKHFKWLETNDAGVAGFLLEDLEAMDTWKKIAVYYNVTAIDKLVSLKPEGSWSIAVKDQEASLQSIGTVDREILIPPVSTVVLFQKE